MKTIVPFLLINMMMFAACGKSKESKDDQGGDKNESFTWPTQLPLPVITGEVTYNLTAAATDNYVNVMGTSVPRMPGFPQITPKPGKVRGFVSNLKGEPIEGAKVSSRAGAGVYVLSEAVTNKAGYYEINAFQGCQISVASCKIAYGNSNTATAGLSLYPVDGKISVSQTEANAGIVKNWVRITYGPGDPDKRANDPKGPEGHAGGSISIYYLGYHPVLEPTGIRPGTINIKLTPVAGKTLDEVSRTFNIIKPTDGSDGFIFINDVPLGQYEISIKHNGTRALKMKHTDTDASAYASHGLFPRIAGGTAQIFFIPRLTDATSPPQVGFSKQVFLTLVDE